MLGRPRIEINESQLRTIMRFKPTLEDAAAFFECSPDTISRFILENYNLTFADFRAQNLVGTRFALIRKALQKALKGNGDNEMLKFCNKNMNGWADKPAEAEQREITQVKLAYKNEPGLEKYDKPVDI